MTTVPSFQKIWKDVPESTTPRTLDAAIAFLNQLDDAIDLDDAGINVWGVLTDLIRELKELERNLKAMREDKGAHTAPPTTC